jgi:GH3 auxin-responsive promoter
MKATFANTAWYLSLLKEAGAFHVAVKNTVQTQEQVLLETLKRNQDTVFGQRHKFSSIHSSSDYQALIPLSTYEDYQPYIERIARGEQNILTADKVKLLEPTSGSTSARKLIPYTASLQQSFMRGIAPWVVNLFQTCPDLLYGTAYWSLSPVIKREHTSAGIPIGFEEDSAYLGCLGVWLNQAVMAVPSEVKFVESIHDFRYITLLFLLKAQNLRLISVWNPTFLSLLVENLFNWKEQLANDIEKGEVSLELSSSLKTRLLHHHCPNPKRAKEIRTIDSSNLANLCAQFWPRLKLISCWTDANAAPYAQQLQKLFPQATFQGKGLIATEGFISLPLGLEAPALAIRSHFFEFVDEAGNVKLAHQLESRQTYSVVLTTDTFYRYQLFDRVKVVGFYQTCPLIRFVGKEALVSDHFGEKLNEHHVRQTLEMLFAKYQLAPTFILLSCEIYAEGSAYTLFIEGAAVPNAFAHELDEKLRENPHYDYCRRLGQLGIVCVQPIHKGATHGRHQAQYPKLQNRMARAISGPKFITRAQKMIKFHSWTTQKLKNLKLYAVV